MGEAALAMHHRCGGRHPPEQEGRQGIAKEVFQLRTAKREEEVTVEKTAKGRQLVEGMWQERGDRPASAGPVWRHPIQQGGRRGEQQGVRWRRRLAGRQAPTLRLGRCPIVGWPAGRAPPAAAGS
jgi:hypothetical protein